MTTEILRPIFSENQIISADDINKIVSHSRDAQARHNRYLHNWGIVTGLKFETEEKQSASANWIEVLVTPGVAIDGSGREIVVSESQRLSEDLFIQLNIEQSSSAGQTPAYPVYLVGQDQSQQANITNLSACQQANASRVAETYTITFGRVGSAVDLDQQSVPEPSQGPGDGSNNSWQILLGFVQWENGHFVGVLQQHENITPRYAGVRANDVIALNGQLHLRSAESNQTGKSALVIDDTNGGEMRFGLQDSTGKVVPVLTVNAQGDVIAEGRILGAVAGGVQIESGVASHGTTLPLPQGVTQAQIDAGDAHIQISVSPRYQQSNVLSTLGLTAGAYWVMNPLDCYVLGREVVCRNHYYASNDVTINHVLPGVCDYNVFAFVNAE